MAPRTNEVDPVVTVEEGGPRDGARVESHPAYAMIAASHATGRRRLFGTSFEHTHFVRLRVQPATVTRDLHHDWYHARMRPYIEVDLSEAQWVGMISRTNTEGVPCTVTFVDGAPVPGIGERESKEQQIRREVDERMDKTLEAIDTLSELLKDVTLKVGDRKRVESALGALRSAAGPNVAFTVQSMHEEISKSIDNAKIEVEAYFTHRIASAGLEALREGSSPLLVEAARGRADEEV